MPYVKNADGSYTLDADTLGKLVDKAKPGEVDPYAGIELPDDPASLSDAELEKLKGRLARAHAKSQRA